MHYWAGFVAGVLAGSDVPRPAGGEAALPRVASTVVPGLRFRRPPLWTSYESTLRMVVSYFGPGTEYVDGATFDRAQLGSRGAAVGAREASAAAGVERAPSGAVVMLKGELWPGNVGAGAVHRSPATSAQSPRLVLTLDAL